MTNSDSVVTSVPVPPYHGSRLRRILLAVSKRWFWAYYATLVLCSLEADFLLTQIFFAVRGFEWIPLVLFENILTVFVCVKLLKALRSSPPSPEQGQTHPNEQDRPSDEPSPPREDKPPVLKRVRTHTRALTVLSVLWFLISIGQTVAVAVVDHSRRRRHNALRLVFTILPMIFSYLMAVFQMTAALLLHWRAKTIYSPPPAPRPSPPPSPKWASADVGDVSSYTEGTVKI